MDRRYHGLNVPGELGEGVWDILNVLLLSHLIPIIG